MTQTLQKLLQFMLLLVAGTLPCVSQVGPLRLQIIPANVAVLANNTKQLTATVAFIGNRSGGTDVTSQVIWNSSDMNIASITAAGVVTGVIPGTVTITASRGPFRASIALTVIPNSPLTSLTIAPKLPFVAKGLPQQFTATGMFQDGSSQNLSSAVAWSSSNITVAAINPSGMARTLSTGPTTIMASFGGFNDSTTLTVLPPVPQSLVVNPVNPMVPLGLQQQFSALLILTDGSTQDVTSSAVWSSSTPAFATISNPGGLATTLAVGMTIITASSNGFMASSTLTVLPPALASIAITPANPVLQVAANLQLKATGTFTDGTMQDMTQLAFWNSSNSAIASVSSTGLVNGIGPGNVTIGASYNGVAASTNLTVLGLVSISITPANPSVPAGGTQQLTATGNFSDGSMANLTNSVAWSASAPNVASVNATGVVSAKLPGTSTVTATLGKVSGSTLVTVTFTNASLNGQYAFTINGTDANGQFFLAGSFQADGNGNLLNGMEDLNDGLGVSPNISFITGTYSIGPDGRGMALLSTGDNFAFIVENSGNGTLSEFSSSAIGAGSFARQNPAAFNATALQGNFVFQLAGISASGSIVEVGGFTGDGAANILNGISDFNDTGSVGSGGTFSGTYSVASNGRGTATFVSAGVTSNLSFYVIDQNQINIVSLDFVPALLGNANRQSLAGFSNSILQGTYVFATSGALSNDGFITSFPIAAAGEFTASGAGGISAGVEDVNNNGALTQNLALNGNYAVSASRGHFTFSLASTQGTSNYVGYPISSSAAYFIQSDSIANVSGTLQLQQGSNFSSAALQGGFATLLGGLDITNVTVLTVSAQLTSDGAGNLNGTEDANDGGTIASALSINGTYSIAGNGRGSVTLTDSQNTSYNLNFYVVSGSSIVIVDEDTTLLLLGFGESQF